MQHTCMGSSRQELRMASQASVELRWLQQVQSQAHSAATIPVHSWHTVCHLPLVLLSSHQEKCPPIQGACVFPLCISAQTSVLRWDAVALTVQCMYDKRQGQCPPHCLPVSLLTLKQPRTVPTGYIRSLPSCPPFPGNNENE